MWKIIYNQEDGTFKKIITQDLKLEQEKIRFRPKFYSVCGSDKSIVSKHRKISHPVVIGHELSGYVMEGSGYDMEGKRIKIGDPITILPNFYCGKCIDCIHGHYNTCRNKVIIGVEVDGGLAEYMDLEPKFALKLPNDYELEYGSLIEPLAVGVHALEKFHNKNRQLLIIGGGGTGALAYIAAKHLGFKNPKIIETYKNKIEILKEQNFEVYDNIEEAIDNDTRPINILDTVNDDASEKNYEKSMDLVASGSEIVVTGLFNIEIKIPTALLIRKEYSVEGSIIYLPKDFITARDIIYENTHEFKRLINIVELDKLTDLNQLNDVILNNDYIKNIVKIY